MVVLRFNQELSLFVEEEDPLQSSLHLEDLPSLQSSGSENSDDCQRMNGLNETMKTPKALGIGTFNGAEIDLYASLPEPPSFEDDDLEAGEGLDPTDPRTSYSKSQTMLDKETEEAITPRPDSPQLNDKANSPQLSDKAKILNKLRSPSFRRAQHARYKELDEGMCSYNIPHASTPSKNSNEVNRVLEETSAIRSTPHLDDDDDVSSTCASRSTTSISAATPSAFSEKLKARDAVRKQYRSKKSKESKGFKVGKKIRGDKPDLSDIDSISNVSVATTNTFSSRVAGRLSKAFTPKWVARRKIESEAKKKVILVHSRKGDHKENTKTKQNHDGTSSYDIPSNSIHGSESKKEVKILQSPARLKRRSKSLQYVEKPKSLTKGRRSISDTNGYSAQYKSRIGMNTGAKSVVVVSPKKHSSSNGIRAGLHKSPVLHENEENDVSYHINHFSSPSVRTIEIPRYTFDDDESIMSAANSLGMESVSSGNAANTRMASTRPYRTPSNAGLSVDSSHSSSSRLSPMTLESSSQNSFGSQYLDQQQTPSSSRSNNSMSRSNSGRKTLLLDPCPSPYSVDSSWASDVASTASSYTALSNLSFRDPCAKQSKIVKRSNLDISGKGDGDIWVEKIFVSKRTGKRRTFFVSVTTGRRIKDEPPTGASKVIYSDDLKELTKEEVRMTVPSFINLASC